MRWLVLLLVVLAPACAPLVEPGAPALDREVVLREGERVVLDEGRLTLAFEEVPEDSRCPEGAACVWAGEAIVILRAEGQEGEGEVLALRTPPAEGSAAPAGAYRVELLALSAAPLPGAERTPYVATLRVVR